MNKVKYHVSFMALGHFSALTRLYVGVCLFACVCVCVCVCTYINAYICVHILSISLKYDLFFIK